MLVPGAPVDEGSRLAPPDRITLGVDARDPVGAAVEFALEAAQRAAARLRAVNAWTLPTPSDEWPPFALPEKDRATWEDQEVQLLSDTLRPWLEKYPDTRVLEDVVLFNPAKALVRASARSGLLVVGQRGSRLGTTVHAVAHHSRSPLAVVPE